MPANDLKPHVGNGKWCPCAPEVRTETNGILVIHNSWDGREFFENDAPDVNDPTVGVSE